MTIAGSSTAPASEHLVSTKVPLESADFSRWK
jgi:hypothetical protein